MPLKEKLRQTLLSLLLPLIYIVFIILLLKNAQIPKLDYPTLKQFVLVNFSIISAIVFIWANFLVKPTLQLKPKKTPHLITRGPYRFVRHPSYTSLIVLCISISFLLKASAAVWYTLIVITPIYLIRAIWEEKILSENFGKKYEAYRKKTLF